MLAGDLPAFAVDPEQRITSWNSSAARLFDRDPADVLGRACFKVIGGRDRFGNRFCCRGCPVLATARESERVTACALRFAARTRHAAALVQLFLVPGCEAGRYTIVHVLKLPQRLTDRESEVMRWLARGLQNKEVAARLEISPATVRIHVHNILDKLGVHSKLEAVSLAFRSEWLFEDSDQC